MPWKKKTQKIYTLGKLSVCVCQDLFILNIEVIPNPTFRKTHLTNMKLTLWVNYQFVYDKICLS